MGGAEKPAGDSIQSVVTALAVIEHMAQAGGPIGVTDLARALGLTKPRIYRHLRTLLDLGYVAQDERTDLYRLTLSLFHIGQAIAAQTDFVTEARRVLPELQHRVAQTVTVGHVEAEGVRVLDILRQRSDIEITTAPGALFDFHSSAQGKVALAFGPESLWRALEGKTLKRWTVNTNTDLKALHAEVDIVRSRGWAVAPEEAMIGLNALAAPVFEGGGALAGTITIVGSVQFLTPQPDRTFIDALLETAGQISRALGYRG